MKNPTSNHLSEIQSYFLPGRRSTGCARRFSGQNDELLLLSHEKRILHIKFLLEKLYERVKLINQL